MEEEIASEDPRYYIELEGDGDTHRSMSVMISGRKCYEHRPADAGRSQLESDPQGHISDIVSHCSETADYLLQDTPLKEAIFRVLLAGGNEPMTAREVSEILTSRWTMSAYPRELSPRVVGRLLDHAEGYRIVAIPEPEPEPELLVAEIAEVPEDTGAIDGPEAGPDTEETAPDGAKSVDAEAAVGQSTDAEQPPADQGEQEEQGSAEEEQPAQGPEEDA